MGIMDTVRQETRPTSQGFLSADERHGLVEAKQPFNIVRMTRGTSSKFNKDQWFVDIEFLHVEDGSLIIVADDEGAQMTVRRCITFNASPSRDQEFPVIERKRVEMGGSLGPLILERVAVANQPNPAYIFKDWAGPQNQAVPAPAPSTPTAAPAQVAPQGGLISPDGKYMLVDGKWHPVPPLPGEPEPEVQAVPASSVLPFSAAAGGNSPSPSALPPVGVMQPLPGPDDAVVMTGGDGEGGQLQTTAYKGDKIRQAVYREEGKVQQPSGVVTQNVAPERPVESRGIAQEAPKPSQSVPGQSAPEAPVADVLAAAPGTEVKDVAAADIPPNSTPAAAPAPTGGQKKAIPMQAKCDTCQKTIKGSSFKNSKGRWILTHTCSAVNPQTNQPYGSKTIDVHDQVTAILQDVINE